MAENRMEIQNGNGSKNGGNANDCRAFASLGMIVEIVGKTEMVFTS